MTSLEAAALARHEFLEAARYIVASPEATKRHLHAAVVAIEQLLLCSHAGEPIKRGPLVRIGENIQAGLDAMLVDPDVLRGYIVGARHELACVEAGLRAEAEKKTLDNERNEVYREHPDALEFHRRREAGNLPRVRMISGRVDVKLPGEEWQCGLSQEAARILVTAYNHQRENPACPK